MTSVNRPSPSGPEVLVFPDAHAASRAAAAWLVEVIDVCAESEGSLSSVYPPAPPPWPCMLSW